MGIIINDFSLEGQFSTIDEFIESIYCNTIPMLDKFEVLNIDVLKSYNCFNLMVTESETLHDIMKIRGVPEITKFKKQLNTILLDEPYWENSIQSNNNIYESRYTEKLDSYCLAEALERNMPVMSFEHDKFKESTLIVKKDNEEYIIQNLYNKAILLDIFRENNIISHLEYLLDKYNLKNSFGLKNNKNYFNEMCSENRLNEDDISNIINDIERLIIFTEKGEDPGRLSKTIDGKLKEFRTSLSSSREVRIFYIENKRNIIFLNGFLKKTQRTPVSEIDKAKRIMSEY